MTILFGSCIKEDQFGQSKYNTLYNYILEGQLGDASVDQATGLVTCNMDSTVDVRNLKLTSYNISNYATINPQTGDVLDYTDTVECTVTAENGIPRIYKVVVQDAKQNEQIPNSGFQQWYDTGSGYLEPGTGPDKIIWSTGNEGAIIAGNVPTYPEVIGSNDTTAVLETMAVTIGPRISAGSLFTGTFELNIINIPASIKPGIPFTSRPVSYKLNMKYVPGETNLDGQGNPVPHPDEADIYVLLEVRSGDDTKRLATGWYRSSDTYSDWFTLEMDMIYGALDSSYPDFMKPANGEYADPSATPTHISVVMSSSAGGGQFQGAVGSILEVNDLELIY